MATVRVLVDTNVLIDYLNRGEHAFLLAGTRSHVYYSVVTRRELLAKRGLKDSERQAILGALRRFRLIPVTHAIAARYARVRAQSPRLDRADALIAATALEERLPLMTRNWRHFRGVEGLVLYAGR